MAIIDFLKQILDTHGIAYMIGQGFGIVAIILGFVSYQVKTRSHLILVQSATAAVFCIHYGLLGAYSAMAMNAVNIVRNLFYENRAKKGSKSLLIPIIFVAIQIVICALTWEAWYSVFVLIGIGINTFCMSFYDPQNIRKSILVSSPAVLTYDVFARSIGGIIYESVAIVSAAIGVFRFKKSNN